jgi:hypothetical protein
MVAWTSSSTCGDLHGDFGRCWEIESDRTTTTGLDNFKSDYVAGSFLTVTAVPEPATLALVRAGIMGLAAMARRE